MTTRPMIVGAHVFWAPEGGAFTIPSSGTVSRSAKPGSTDTIWATLGVVKDAELDHARSETEIFAPLPGQKRLYDVIETMRKLTLKVTLENVSPLVMQLVFGSLPLNASSTQFNPLEGSAVKGWAKLQLYDDQDQLVLTVDAYCRMKLASALALGDSAVQPSIEFSFLHSTLNTGSLTVA